MSEKTVATVDFLSLFAGAAAQAVPAVLAAIDGDQWDALNAIRLAARGEEETDTDVLPEETGVFIDGLDVGYAHALGIYKTFSRDVPANNEAYDNVDPLKNPKVYVNMVGVDPLKVTMGISVDGADPTDVKHTDVEQGEVGDEFLVAFEYPKTAAARTVGPHTLKIWFGMAEEIEAVGTHVTWFGSSKAFTVNVIRDRE